jgi:PQQ-dependent catabolism-associated beta-propeller protein
MPFPLRKAIVACRLPLLAALAALAAGAARADTIYVSNEKGNSITVLDNSLKVIKTVPVGQRPRGIVLSKDGHTLYICASDDNEIEQLDLDDYTMKPPLPSGADPENFALHPDGKHLYVANEDNSLVTIVDIEQRSVAGEIPVGVEPEGMGISPDGKWIVNTSETTSMAHFISNATHEVVANVLVDTRPRRAVWTADGKEVWVSSEIGGSVSVIDPETHKIAHKITFAVSGVPKEAIQAVGIAITRDRKLAFVALGPANRVAVVDAQTYEVKKYLLVGQRVWNLAFNHDESRLYTTNGVSNDISEIDVPNLRVLLSVPVGAEPWGVVARP